MCVTADSGLGYGIGKTSKVENCVSMERICRIGILQFGRLVQFSPVPQLCPTSHSSISIQFPSATSNPVSQSHL